MKLHEIKKMLEARLSPVDGFEWREIASWLVSEVERLESKTSRDELINGLKEKIKAREIEIERLKDGIITPHEYHEYVLTKALNEKLKSEKASLRLELLTAQSQTDGKYCRHIFTTDEGTSHCNLAFTTAEELSQLKKDNAVMQDCLNEIARGNFGPTRADAALMAAKYLEKVGVK